MFDVTDWEAAIASSDPMARIRADLTEVSMEELAESAGDSLSMRLVELLKLKERLDAEVTRVAALWQGVVETPMAGMAAYSGAKAGLSAATMPSVESCAAARFTSSTPARRTPKPGCPSGRLPVLLPHCRRVSPLSLWR